MKVEEASIRSRLESRLTGLADRSAAGGARRALQRECRLGTAAA